MKEKTSPFIVLAALSCFLACIGDFAVTFLLGFLYPGYNFLNQSESYLGASESPVALYMTLWGIIFSMLFILFAYGLRKSIFQQGRWQILAVWLIVIYGIGEGLGSGLFPYDHIGNELTRSGKLHSLFSGIGETGLVLLPFVLLKIFPRSEFPGMYLLSVIVGLTGLAFIIIFLLARPIHLPYRGLWQRVFLLDYYSLMMILAVDMVVLRLRPQS